MKVNPLNDKGDEENRGIAIGNQSSDAAAAAEEDANIRETNKKPRTKIGALLLLMVLMLAVIVLAVTLPLVLEGSCCAPPDDIDENITQVPYDWNCSEMANVTSIYEASVNGIAELLRDHQVPPEHLIDFEDMNPAVQDGDFNVSSYFDVLGYLFLPQGTILDYVYVFNGMGGFPLLYVRNQTDERFATANDLIYAKNCSSPWTCPNYLNEIIVDNSPPGFLQFVILDVKGDQFYLFWHDNYNDYKIITTSASVEEIVQSYPPCQGDEWEGQYGCFDTEHVEMARSLDVTPTIQCNDTMVEVGVVLFTEWGGFVQRTYALSREADAGGDRIVGTEQEVLVSFDIGIAF